MNYWLAQLILAARNRDRDTGWVQILVFVVLIVFYALGSIVKAKANKTALEEDKQIPRKPARKSPEGARELFRELFKQPQRPAGPAPSSQPHPQVQPPRRKVARPQPAVGRKPPTKAGLKLEDKRVAMPAEKQPARYLSEILSDYDDPEKLRRAILHYEILGKPISLRDPSEHII